MGEVLYWLVNKTLYLQFHDFFERPYLFCCFPSFNTNSPPSIQPLGKFLELLGPSSLDCLHAPWSLLIPLEHIWFHVLLNISRGGHGGGGSSKWRTLPWLTPNICVFPPCDRGFWLLTTTNGQFFSLMCQHAVVSKGCCWPSSNDSTYLLYVEGVDSFVKNASHFYFEMCCHYRWGLF